MENKAKHYIIIATLVENKSGDCMTVRDKIYKIEREEGDPKIGEVIVPSSFDLGFGQYEYPRDVLAETLKQQIDKGNIPKRFSLEYTVEY